MSKWEYLVDSDTHESSLQEELDRRGSDGWELVAFHAFVVVEGGYREEHEVRRYTLIHKKMVQE